MSSRGRAWWLRWRDRIELITAPEVEPRWLLRVLAGIPLPVLAVTLQLLLSAPDHRAPWIGSYPAIFFSSWLGGFVGGLTATLLSMMLVGWFILPAHGPIGVHWLVQMLLVLLLGTLGSLVFEGFRRAVRRLRAANRLLGVEADRATAAERLLDEARRRLQLAADSAGVAIWSFDLGTGRTEWDARMSALFEVPQEPESRGIEHEFFRSRVHPDDLQLIDREVAQAETLGSGGQRYRICLPDGRVRVVQGTWLLMRDDAGRPIAMTGTCRDVTGEVLAYEQLQASMSRLELAREAAEIGLWRWEFASGRLEWDQRMLDWFEVPESLRRGALTLDFFLSRVHPDDVDRTLDTARAAAEVGQRYQVLYRVVVPSGAVLSMAAAAVVERNGSGMPVAMVGINRDVTDAVEAADELRRAKEAAERSEQAKSEFLSAAAHELRTPMASVHGFAELLASREFDPQTTQSVARTIHRQSSLLVQLVNELLDLARIESGRGLDFAMKRQALWPVVRETAESLVIPDDPRRVELRPGEGEPAWVVVDEAKLRQSVTNVLSNAFKYSAGRGAVRVTLPTRTVDGHEQVGVRVEDEGVGMSPEQLSRAFERFYRAEPAGPVPGTGLGLALTKEIVEAMHGHVEVASEPGRGTQVTLWLPVAQEGADRS